MTIGLCAALICGNSHSGGSGDYLPLRRSVPLALWGMLHGQNVFVSGSVIRAGGSFGQPMDLYRLMTGWFALSARFGSRHGKCC